METPQPPGAPLAPRLPAPAPGEPPDAYLARLHAEQRRLADLVEALERGLDRGVAPAALPPHMHHGDAEHEPVPARGRGDRRIGGADRRSGARDRRRGPRDRRSGRPDARAQVSERRAGPPDRRSGRATRRFGHDRRSSHAALAPRVGGLDPALVFWAVNILCWAAVAVVALVYGAR